MESQLFNELPVVKQLSIISQALDLTTNTLHFSNHLKQKLDLLEVSFSSKFMQNMLANNLYSIIEITKVDSRRGVDTRFLLKSTETFSLTRGGTRVPVNLYLVISVVSHVIVTAYVDRSESYNRFK